MSEPVDRQDLLEICRYALTDGTLFDELREYLDITDEEMISIADRVFLETEGELVKEEKLNHCHREDCMDFTCSKECL